MNNLRTYGKKPFRVAVIHGGPGARGEMAPVARELAARQGILEPLQTATSLKEQIEELRTVLEEHGDLPLTLLGFSWGAWLGFLVAARYPAIVSKLILVGSGPYEAKYATTIQTTRLARLQESERHELKTLIEVFNTPMAQDDSTVLARIGVLCAKADAYDPINESCEEIDCQVSLFHGVWKDAEELRRGGKLLQLGARIRCPVVAIHGDYDPHPADGVKKPLSALLKDFRWNLLQHCGHKPWIEQQAKSRFYDILKEELS